MPIVAIMSLSIRYLLACILLVDGTLEVLMMRPIRIISIRRTWSRKRIYEKQHNQSALVLGYLTSIKF